MALAVTAMIGVRTPPCSRFGGAQPSRQLVAVHARHVDVGEHRGVAAVRRPRLERIDAVRCAVGGDPKQLELQHENLAVHRMIVDHQDARTFRLARATLTGAGASTLAAILSGESAGAA